MQFTSSLKNSIKSLWAENLFLATPLWLSVFAVIFLLFYAFFMMTADAVGSYAQRGVAAIGFIVWLWRGGQLRKSGISWLLLAAILIPLISWGLSCWHHPQWAESSPKVHRLTSWFLCVPVAVLLGGRIKNTFLLWSVAIAGLMFAPWLSGQGLPELMHAAKGLRVDFGLHNAQHAGMLFAVSFLGLVVFAPRVFSISNFRWAARLVWLLTASITFSGVLVTQTRGIWLGLASAVLLVALLSLSGRRKRKISLKFLLISSALSCLIIIVVMNPVFSIIENRLAQEKQEISLILQGNFKDLNNGSIGVRVKTWQEAFLWIKKRPFVGWGGNGRGIVYDNSESLPEEIKQNFRHFHNSYIDALVSYGLFGLSLSLAFFGWFSIRLYRLYVHHAVSYDMCVFYASFLALWFIANLFESYMFYSSGSFVLSLVMGGFLTLIWKYDQTAD